MNVRTLTIFAVAVFSFGAAEPRADAQDGLEVAVTLTGRVTDAGDGRAIAGAQVILVGENRGVLSDGAGRYLIALDDRWVGREVTVLVQSLGHAMQRQTHVLAMGSNVLDFSLQPAALALESVMLSVSRSDAKAPMAMLRSVVAAPARQLPSPVHLPEMDRESYALIEENPFLAAGPNPLSTFSIDVDRASYSNVRRHIREGARPPIDAVRIEELVNYFTYGDAEPDGDAPFSVTTEVAPAPWQPLHHLVRIGLRSAPVDLEDIPASNLVFLIDVSGSMQAANKLPLLKTAFGMLVDQLRPQDRVALVAYAGAAGLVLESTPGSEKDVILDALERLEAGGSTAGGAGIELAYRVARENHIAGGNNRVILATDGDFNVGASSDAEMVRLIEEKREQGTYLTVLGFGTGNLQDSKMEQLADHGNGNFSYIDSALEARKVLVTEMGGTLLTVAKDVKLQVEFNPERVAAYRLIGYENRLLADEDFADDSVDAGDMGAGHSVTALYEVIPVGVDSPTEVRGLEPLRYQTREVRTRADDRPELMFVQLRYKEPDGTTSRLLTHPVSDEMAEPSEDFRFAAAVAAWGMLLRDSEHCEGFGLDDVGRLARGAMGEDREGYRAEFVSLVEATRSLELLDRDPR